MAIKYLDAKRIRALSSDTLPTNISSGAIAELTDTYKYKWFNGTNWTPVDWTYGISLGGQGDLDLMNKVTIATTGNASNIGNMNVNVNEIGYGTSDRTRGLVAGSANAGSRDFISYFTIATASTTIDFGNLSLGRAECGMVSDLTLYAVGGGDSSGGGAYSNVIDYGTIQTTGNAADFGDLTTTKAYVMGSSDFFGTSGKGWFHMVGSYNSTSAINVISIGTPGNATSYGALTHTNAQNAMESDSRCASKGGAYSNSIQYWGIPTYSTAVDFGNTAEVHNMASGGFTNKTRGVIHGGNKGASGRINYMEYITIATTGDATTFGDLSESTGLYASASASGA